MQLLKKAINSRKFCLKLILIFSFLTVFFPNKSDGSVSATPNPIQGSKLITFSREPNCIFKSYSKVLCIETSATLGSLQKF